MKNALSSDIFGSPPIDCFGGKDFVERGGRARPLPLLRFSKEIAIIPPPWALFAKRSRRVEEAGCGRLCAGFLVWSSF